MDLKERSAAQEHFIDLCNVFEHPTPAAADPTGENFCFEKGAAKHARGDGFADVWKRGCFGFEYKGTRLDTRGQAYAARCRTAAQAGSSALAANRIVGNLSRNLIRDRQRECRDWRREAMSMNTAAPDPEDGAHEDVAQVMDLESRQHALYGRPPSWHECRGEAADIAEAMANLPGDLRVLAATLEAAEGNLSEVARSLGVTPKRACWLPPQKPPRHWWCTKRPIQRTCRKRLYPLWLWGYGSVHPLGNRPFSSRFRREKSVKLKNHLSHDLDGGGETRGLCRHA